MAESKISGNQLSVTVKGMIDHSFGVSLVKLENVESVLINMQEVTFMNSAGIRQFITWIREVEKAYRELRVVLTLVPPAVNRQLSSLQSHLPAQLSIDSVYLPYYCDACDYEDRTRLVTTKDVANAETLDSITAQQIPCPKCSAPMDFDGFTDQYFGLLTARK